MYTTTVGSQPIIISVLRYQGLRRYVAVLGMLPPSGPNMYGPIVFKLAGLVNLARPNAFKTSEPARTTPDSLSPYRGTIFKPFGLVGELNFEHTDRPKTLTLLGWLRESRAPLPDGRTLTISAGYLNVVAWW